MESEEEVLVDIALDEVCPICLEGKDLHKLSCSHLIHIDCAKGMTDALCPLCRSSIEKDLPTEILKSIEDRGQEYQANLEAEDRERLSLHVENPGMTLTLFVRPRPHIETLAAINYLRRQGVPLEFLPQRIQIKRMRGHPPPRPGTIFQMLVGHALARMQSVVDGFSSDSDNSDDEICPYEYTDGQVIDITNIREMVDVTEVDPEA